MSLADRFAMIYTHDACHAAVRRIAAALCISVLVGCAVNPRLESTRLALVIGNAAYENAKPLANPVNDAADMCDALRRVGFKTLCHTDVRDRAEFDEHVKDYVDQLQATSVGVFYYAGHGVQAGQVNYLVPTRAQPRTAADDPTLVLYSVDDLFERLGSKPSRLQFVVLDACRTDLFARGSGQTMRSTLLRSLEGLPGAATGLQRITDAPAADTIVLYATASKEAAYDGDGRNGPLTKHILQHIGTRGLFIEEFIKRVTAGVEQETRKLAKPQKVFTYASFSGKFCFAGCPGEIPPPPPWF